MKKSLIALAVAGAFLSPAAMAEVTISGAINMGLLLGDSSDGTGAPGTGFSNNSLHSTYSNINISSSDDIGNGNRVIFNFQLDLSGTSGALPNAGNAPKNRNSYLGVAGNWGAVKYGVNENVYERHMYQADPLDGAAGPGGNLLILGTASSALGASTIFEVGQGGCDDGSSQALPNGNPGCMGFYRRADQQIWYESPNWNGFTFEVDYSLSAFKTPAGTDPRLLSAGVKWAPEGMPFYVDLAIERHEDMFGVSAITGTPITSGSSDDGIQIGAGYTFGSLGLAARYERLTYESDGVAAGLIDTWERDAFWFGAKWSLPTGYVAGTVGIANEGECEISGGGACTAGDETGATLLGLGYFHNLSKQSQLQFIYNQISNDSSAAYVAFGTFSNLPGQDHKGIYVGIKHVF